MTGMMSRRTAEVIVALAVRPATMADGAGAIRAPLSSVQRVLEVLAREGLALREGSRRGTWRLAAEPGTPAAALARWLLGRERTAAIEAAMAGPGEGSPRPDRITTRRLRALARRLVWWLPPARALRDRDRLLGQVMSLGTWDDVELARAVYGDDAFRGALARASPGVFDRRSWAYWHARYDLPEPPRPERRLA